jgi:integrase
MARVNRYRKWTHDNWPQPWRAKWRASIRKGDAFRPGGPATKLSERAVWNDETAFGRYLEFLSAHGLSEQAGGLTLDYLRQFSQHLGQSVAPFTVLALLSQVIAAVRLMYPAADLRAPNRAIARFASTVRAVRNVEDRLLDPLILIAVGEAMMAEAEAQPLIDEATATLFRNGALIMAGALFPLRTRNWRMMRTGQHLDLATGRVTFTAHEMKRKKDFEAVLDPVLLLRIRRLVSHYRPVLLEPGARDQGYLWAAPSGGITHRNTLGQIVKRSLRKRTRKLFNFHCFRASAATFISEVAPERAHMASGVLHHSRLSTTDKYYVKGRKRQAFQIYQSAVRDIIARGRSRRSRTRRTRR